MKIHFASQSFHPNIGGVTTHLMNLLTNLRKMGHDVSEVHLRPPKAKVEDEIKKIPVYRIPKTRLTSKLMNGFGKFKKSFEKTLLNQGNDFKGNVYDLNGYKEFLEINRLFGEALDELLKNHPAEICHVHDFQFQLSLVYKYISRGMPLILTWHGPFLDSMNEKARKFIIEHMNAYDKIIFLTQEYLQNAIDSGLKKEKGKVIPSIANSEIFKPKKVNKKSVKKKYSIPKNSKMILCVQRMDWRSSHKQLIKSMPKILEKNPDAVLVFVGEESLGSEELKKHDIWDTPKSEFISLIKKHDLEDKVVFLGNLDNSKLPELYNTADVFASLGQMEGFSISITEAMLCGKPIVGTNVGGTKSQVKNNKNGFLVEVMDIKDTAEKISKILSNRSLREKMGKNSLKISKKFHPDKVTQQHTELYREILKEKSDMWRLQMMQLEDIGSLITSFDGVIAKKGKINKKAVKKLKSLRKPLIMATNRKFSYTKKLNKKYPIWRAIVSENGAVVYYPETKKVIITDSIYMKKARSIIRKSGVNANIGKVMIKTKQTNEKKIKKLLSPVSSNLKFEKNNGYVIVVPKYVNKSKGVFIVMKHFKMKPEDSLLFGSRENDMGLFKVPGYSISLKNSNEKIKSTSDEVTEKSYGKGVIEAINKIKK